MKLFYEIARELFSVVRPGKKAGKILMPKYLSPKFDSGGVSSDAALRVNSQAYEHDKFKIWEVVRTDESLKKYLQILFDEQIKQRVVVLDLASIDAIEAKLSVCRTILDFLWKAANKNSSEVITKSREDKRTPIFIVIDEAHNLAPFETESIMAQTVLDLIMRIATEGRKYGLFLILITQRPSRIHPTVLSQCDNLILQKMNNHHDLNLVKKTFGFIPEESLKLLKQVLEFKIGDAMLCGNFIDGIVNAYIAKRRTTESGGNIPDEYWLQDPVS